MIMLSSGLIIMSIMQSLRRTFLIIGFLLGLIFGPMILAGTADLSFTQLAVSAHDRAVYAELAARRLPWMPELYETAGMAALQADEYQYAIFLLKTARLKSALTPDG